MFERILEQNCQTFDNFNFEFSMSHHNAHYQPYKKAPDIEGCSVCTCYIAHSDWLSLSLELELMHTCDPIQLKQHSGPELFSIDGASFTKHTDTFCWFCLMLVLSYTETFWCLRYEDGMICNRLFENIFIFCPTNVFSIIYILWSDCFHISSLSKRCMILTLNL